MTAINVVTVTIGRNVPATPPEWIAQPLSSLDWTEFQNAVASALWQTSSTNGEAWEERHYGTAVWDGVPEESAKVTLLGADFTHVVALRQRLETIRGMYAQDAIALSVGTSDLIERPKR
jgi:hypothetical protein